LFKWGPLVSYPSSLCTIYRSRFYGETKNLSEKANGLSINPSPNLLLSSSLPLFFSTSLVLFCLVTFLVMSWSYLFFSWVERENYFPLPVRVRVRVGVISSSLFSCFHISSHIPRGSTFRLTFLSSVGDFPPTHTIGPHSNLLFCYIFNPNYQPDFGEFTGRQRIP
jgi:hypothetical protein